MPTPLRFTLPWLVPLLVCGLWGTFVLLGLDRVLGRNTARARLRPIGVVTFGALAVLVGLRALTLLLQLLGAMRVGFRASLILVVAATMGAGVLLARRYRRARDRGAPEGLRQALVHRPELFALELLVAGFGLVVLFCALKSGVGGWDVYTHWLVVPNEILAFDRMAFFYGPTRSVAPAYPLHQVVLGAAAILISGGRDAVCNAFAGIFVVLAALATIEAGWLLARRARWLAGLALLVLFGVTGSVEVVWGYFYGDALVITGMAFALLGMAYLVTHRERASSVVVWACLTTQLMVKGLGVALALFGCVAWLAIVWLDARRTRRPPAVGWKGIGVLVAIFIAELALPRLFLIGLRSNYLETAPLSSVLQGPVTTLLSTGLSNNAENRILLATSLVLAAVPPLVLARRRKRIVGARLVPVVGVVGYGLVAWALMISVTLLVPDAKSSWPRYATMMGPVLGIVLLLGLSNVGRARPWLTIPAMALAVFGLLTAEYRSYLETYGRWPDDFSPLPHRNGFYEPEKAFFKDLKQKLQAVNGRVIYVLLDDDLLHPYTISTSFAKAGIRAPFISPVATCPIDQIPIGRAVRDWIKAGAATPPPPELDPARDFLWFKTPFAKGGRTFVKLVPLSEFLSAG